MPGTMRRQASKARRIHEWRFQNSRCSTLSEGFVKSSWQTVILTEILKNRTLKSVDGLLITEDSGQFIRTSCQNKECYIHLDYMFDTKSETWISEMVRYSIFQHFLATSKLCASHCNNLYFESLPPKKLSQRTDIQIKSASQFMGKDTNNVGPTLSSILHIICSINVTDICLWFSLLVLSTSKKKSLMFYNFKYRQIV